MAIKKETETKSKVKTAKSATLKAMKDAEEKAVKAVAKVKKAAATKVSKISDEVKKVATKKTAAKTAATKTAEKTSTMKSAATKTATKTAATKTAATKTAVAKTTATKTTKTTAKVATKAASAKATKASEKEVAKLAQSFDAEYLVLMQKDPNWMHAFWEVSENRINEAKHGKGKIVLRLFDIADDLTVQRSKKRKFRDIEVPANARSWYVENTAGKACVAVLGAVSGKNFMPIVESAPVMTFDKSAAAPAEDDAFAKASLGRSCRRRCLCQGFSRWQHARQLHEFRIL